MYVRFATRVIYIYDHWAFLVESFDHSICVPRRKGISLDCVLVLLGQLTANYFSLYASVFH